VAETLEEAQPDGQPVQQHKASSRVPAALVSLAALAVIGTATAYALPKFNRFAERPQRETASVSIPDPVVSAALKDIQSSQQQNTAVLQQNAAVLESLTQSSAAQQVDLKRMSDQLSSLVARTEALQDAATSITTFAISRPQARARVVRTSSKKAFRLPKPVGPVSVGGAPLGPVPAPGSGAG
jgi:hypothetical protein